MLRTTSMLFALSLVTGCVTTQLTPEAQAVRVTTNADAVKNCKYIGAVDGSDRMNGGMVGQMAAEENANRRLRNNAAKMGANVVLMATSTTGMSGSRERGEAYACGEGGQPTPASEAP